MTVYRPDHAQANDRTSSSKRSPSVYAKRLAEHLKKGDTASQVSIAVVPAGARRPAAIQLDNAASDQTPKCDPNVVKNTVTVVCGLGSVVSGLTTAGCIATAAWTAAGIAGGVTGVFAVPLVAICCKCSRAAIGRYGQIVPAHTLNNGTAV